MRFVRYPVLVLFAAALAGCGNGNGNGDGDAAWGGPPDPDAEGNVSVEEFSTYQEGVDEPWERSSVMAASEFLRLDERTAARTTVEAEAGPEGMGPENVTVTLDGLLDDSIRAERWTLAFDRQDDGYRLTSARRTLQCQPDRGHQDFAPEPCT